MPKARRGPGCVLPGCLAPAAPGPCSAQGLLSLGAGRGCPCPENSHGHLSWGSYVLASKKSECLVISLTKSRQFSATNPVCKLKKKKKRKASAQLGGHPVCPIGKTAEDTRLNLL